MLKMNQNISQNLGTVNDSVLLETRTTYWNANSVLIIALYFIYKPPSENENILILAIFAISLK
jgi:hypothetical protein